MKIAFLVGEFPSVSETFILHQITGLIDLGHAVTIYAKRPSQTHTVHADIERYGLLGRTHYHPHISQNHILRFIRFAPLFVQHFWKAPLPCLRSLDFSRYGKMSASLKLFFKAIPFLKDRPNYDVIHCHHGNVGMIGVELRDIGVVSGALITSFHGYDVNAFPRIHGCDVYNRLFRKGNYFTVNSRFTLDQVTRLGCPSEKISKLPVGLNVVEYTFQSRGDKDSEHGVKVLTVARLTEKKGLEYSIRAMAQVIEKYPSTLYRVVGDGPLRSSLQGLIAELKLDERIHLLGWKTKQEVGELYTDSHLFVLASVTSNDGDREGQGLVLQEAQATGLPVVATLHNGFPDSVLEGQSAFLVPERDVDALAEKLIDLIEHRHLWPRMGQMGRTFVEDNFDSQLINLKLVEIYQRVVAAYSRSSANGEPT